MFENLSDEIENLIEAEGRDLKFRVKDILIPLNMSCTPSISYDYLLLDPNSEYSFSNPEMNKLTSEDFPKLSDSQIYFQRIKEVCISDFNELYDNIPFFQVISSPNKKLRDVVEFIFSKNLQPEQIPSFIELRLYTNKIGTKAPRVFGFIGNASIIYILFYDPFHQIFNKTGKVE